MKVPLTTQTKYVNAVISLKDCKNFNVLLGDLKQWCIDNCDMYSFILHDKDILQDGKPKTPHIHICALMKTNRKRLSTILGDISSYIGVSSLAVSIEKMNDVNGSIRYLIHKDNKEKFQYNVTDVTSNLSQEELNIYMTSESGQIGTEKLIETIISCNFDRVEILRVIGLSYYHLYRNVISDIIKEIRGY